MFTISELRRMSLLHLKGNWNICIGKRFIFTLIWILITPINFLIYPMIISGLSYFYLGLTRNEYVDEKYLFGVFESKNKVVILFLLRTLIIIAFVSIYQKINNIFTFVIFIILLILIIIISYSYSQTAFILIDNPYLTIIEALKVSKEMMKGYKFKLFLLNSIFALVIIGVSAVLIIFTILLIHYFKSPSGIAIFVLFTYPLGLLCTVLYCLWALPYYITLRANFYNFISEEWYD